MTSRLGFLGDGMMKSNQIRKKKRTFFSFHFFKFETAQWSLRADIRRMALLSSRGLQSRATYRCTSSSVFQRVHFLFSFPILFHRLLRPILSFLFLMIRYFCAFVSLFVVDGFHGHQFDGEMRRRPTVSLASSFSLIDLTSETFLLLRLFRLVAYR